MVPFIFTKSVVICIHLFSVSIIISPSSMPPPASTITINTYIHFPSPICVLTRTSTHFFEILSHLLIHAIIPCYPIHRSYPCSFSRSFGSSSFFSPRSFPRFLALSRVFPRLIFPRIYLLRYQHQCIFIPSNVPMTAVSIW